MRRIEWSAAQIDEHERAARPRFSSFSHVSVWVHDIELAKRFYIEVLGGRLVLEADDACEVVLGGAIVGMSSRSGGAQPPAAEYPHIGFTIEPEQFLPMKAWLEAHGVTTHEPWTRNGRTAIMFFKDPSGNLFEIYCPDYPGAATLKRGKERAGESGIVRLADLNYDWK